MVTIFGAFLFLFESRARDVRPREWLTHVTRVRKQNLRVSSPRVSCAPDDLELVIYSTSFPLINWRLFIHLWRPFSPLSSFFYFISLAFLVRLLLLSLLLLFLLLFNWSWCNKFYFSVWNDNNSSKSNEYTKNMDLMTIYHYYYCYLTGIDAIKSIFQCWMIITIVKVMNTLEKWIWWLFIVIILII